MGITNREAPVEVNVGVERLSMDEGSLLRINGEMTTRFQVCGAAAVGSATDYGIDSTFASRVLEISTSSLQSFVASYVCCHPRLPARSREWIKSGERFANASFATWDRRYSDHA